MAANLLQTLPQPSKTNSFLKAEDLSCRKIQAIKPLAPESLDTAAAKMKQYPANILISLEYSHISSMSLIIHVDKSKRCFKRHECPKVKSVRGKEGWGGLGGTQDHQPILMRTSAGL